MSYMLLILEPQGQRGARAQREGEELYQRMIGYTESLKARGVLLASDSLRSSAARLSIRGGQPSVIDGPFAESKELIGGFFLIECGTREQALRVAAECPAAEWATIEVREVGPCYE
jgi:hypothetical protein